MPKSKFSKEKGLLGLEELVTGDFGFKVRSERRVAMKFQRAQLDAYKGSPHHIRTQSITNPAPIDDGITAEVVEQIQQEEWGKRWGKPKSNPKKHVSKKRLPGYFL